MKLRNILMGAAASSLCASAVLAERGSDGQVNILYWQAVSIMTPYLSNGTKDQQAASLVIEPLARFDEKGELEPYLAEDIPYIWLYHTQISVIASSNLVNVVNYTLPTGQKGIELQGGSHPLYQIWRRS